MNATHPTTHRQTIFWSGHFKESRLNQQYQRMIVTNIQHINNNSCNMNIFNGSCIDKKVVAIKIYVAVAAAYA